MKQVWKMQSSRKAKGSSARKKFWPVRIFAIIALLATLGAALFDFPAYWNAGVQSVNSAIGVSLPTMEEKGFRLGLDLQGGTHLVYEADMSNILDEDRSAALEGVKDVIERRVNAFGVSEPVVQTTMTGGSHRIIVELAGVLDVSEAIDQIGETPVLEFKEPGEQLQRDPTAEELALLADLQEADKATAQQALTRARSGEDWDKLTLELTTESAIGTISGLTADDPVYGDLVQAIIDTWVSPGFVVPKVVENADGLNIVKYIEAGETEESELSHILICYEGATGCTSGLSEMDATIQINNLKAEATPENFADLAKEYSTGPTGPNGGYIGWVRPGQMVASFEIEALQTPKETISNVVKTEFGYHLIYKSNERSLKTYTLERILLDYTDIFDIIPEASPWTNTELSGKYLEHANVEFDPNTGVPYVALNFNTEGGDLFGELTASHVGEPIAIFLDGEAISTPVVQTAIYGGKAIITGNFTLDEAKLLAQRLNAGALPVPVNLLSQQTIGPTLGAASLSKSVIAGLCGFLLVALFMIAVYRVPGLVAVFALVLYAFLNLATYRLFGVTISLAGIAGFVLSMGIAVDANVLIIERFNEELAAGRDYRSALDEAFQRAWSAIRDGNLTTLIAAGVLYWFSSSFIRGFALTLSIGVLLSMFTAITITRVYLKNVIACSWVTRHKGLFGQGKEEQK
ncbi:MAG: Protein translocase subunit SecD [Candidatus Uhrbacteria bacterium GW2011_GWE2_40_58]|nr:MAG: Protein translocase subunit SecD [Candidatus Uhrbacteria bacterium GW2011_GWF2_40_263]KKR68125.1 MAG: Protein translocase subunit SecD [Candidatus Uhrbacteria bacterium GW2011_GWE2_40_58]OGL93123.1 MAG: protein-export membrane protein SecD [Candidatus Uhrbacteria bacterium RIFOXYA2_FULL_40_9]OGL96621.1 MAG: protein-export membrane protein SecD [Candidatus Uhrbacteria bacterium RIFOXYB2_FULL_41_18]HBK34417.1 protein translocase subunit SecD [Candidatus Uhrbacteria bacterium]